ncbi:hypothetical protein CONPUDRAFT_87046 [Coniophora puteana RWD-64-598 SS2]|uniref:Uncharacterized protein n=1 Tax=Coniophora puteana (strain RWD-64-598) TaxID=741705 RepID=A0A5M3N8G2_CONPW|nr:uncharacterized protein CONPUDRAFT_87046 [Coniophora puteana RWD-64-598 SS2]EIW87135.1 hypothetical protein CONPUDRAFT_87046 [Coniophora puteana RWD-64-598 SS2]
MTASSCNEAALYCGQECRVPLIMMLSNVQNQPWTDVQQRGGNARKRVHGIVTDQDANERVPSPVFQLPILCEVNQRCSDIERKEYRFKTAGWNEKGDQKVCR